MENVGQRLREESYRSEYNVGIVRLSVVRIRLERINNCLSPRLLFSETEQRSDETRWPVRDGMRSVYYYTYVTHLSGARYPINILHVYLYNTCIVRAFAVCSARFVFVKAVRPPVRLMYNRTILYYCLFIYCSNRAKWLIGLRASFKVEASVHKLPGTTGFYRINANNVYA
jgi:hypothetical protein